MRPEHWPSMLEAYVDVARSKPFAWGSHDCVTFVFGWVDMMRGGDLHAPYRGKYATPFGANKLMRRTGSYSLAMFAAKHLPTPIAAPYAQRGDVVFAHDALGLCVGDRGAFFVAGQSIELLPFLFADARAWRV